MEITKDIHRLKVDFKVTEEIERLVYVYILLGENIYLIDSGVKGTETLLEDYLKGIGRDIREVRGIFLTHSHPDHIGGAFGIKEKSGAKIYASPDEKNWIEDIDLQWKERPIPNFYELVDHSVIVDEEVMLGQKLKLEEDITLKVMNAKGHSKGSLAYLWEEEKALFTGDAIPVPGDIPIYVSSAKSIKTLNDFLELKDVDQYLSAWDDPYEGESGRKKIEESLAFMEKIRDVVTEVYQEGKLPMDEMYKEICKRLGREELAANPLFNKSIMANILEVEWRD